MGGPSKNDYAAPEPISPPAPEKLTALVADLRQLSALARSLGEARMATTQARAADALEALTTQAAESAAEVERLRGERDAQEKRIRELEAGLGRCADSMDVLIRELSDPGTEALATVFCARQLLPRAALGKAGLLNTGWRYDLENAPTDEPVLYAVREADGETWVGSFSRHFAEGEGAYAWFPQPAPPPENPA